MIFQRENWKVGGGGGESSNLPKRKLESGRKGRRKREAGCTGEKKEQLISIVLMTMVTMTTTRTTAMKVVTGVILTKVVVNIKIQIKLTEIKRRAEKGRKKETTRG